MSRDSELDQNLSGDFQKFFSSDLNEIWYIGRGRWVMHDGMPYGRNQGQGHSREVDRQSPTGLILLILISMYSLFARRHQVADILARLEWFVKMQQCSTHWVCETVKLLRREKPLGFCLLNSPDRNPGDCHVWATMQERVYQTGIQCWWTATAADSVVVQCWPRHDQYGYWPAV